MALQPIDLQTLFSQMDEVGKGQSVQREGAAIHQSLQSDQIQRRNLERQHIVNETQYEEDGPQRLKDENAHGGGQNAEEERREKERKEAEEAALARLWELPVIRDPLIGTNVDVSG